MKRYFCTCCDHNYMIYGMTLFDSLIRCKTDFKLFVLCLSKEAYSRLSGVDERIELIDVEELEKYDNELAMTKYNRSRTEYIFTMSPCLPLFILNNHPEIDLLAYLDSDLYFYASPEVLFRELGEKSLYIIEHRFSAEHRYRAGLNGRFNMAFQIYRNNSCGISCLEKWRRQCIEWCYDRAEDGKFADQKYLDTWPEDFKDQTVISKNKGANLAPWNIDNFTVKEDDGKFTVDGSELIFVHYQAFKIIGKYTFVWYSWNVGKKNFGCFKKLAYRYFNAARETGRIHRQIFSGVENPYPNRGAFFSPKLEKLLKFVPGSKMKKFLRFVFVILFYGKHVHFKPFAKMTKE